MISCIFPHLSRQATQAHPSLQNLNRERMSSVFIRMEAAVIELLVQFHATYSQLVILERLNSDSMRIDNQKHTDGCM